METNLLTPPSREYIQMNFCGLTANGIGNNTSFIMEKINDDYFTNGG